MYSIGPHPVHSNLWWYMEDGSMSTVAVLLSAT